MEFEGRSTLTRGAVGNLVLKTVFSVIGVFLGCTRLLFSDFSEDL